MKELNNIHWHDCELESVVELPSKDILVLNVQYPEDWEKETYIPKSIIFEEYYAQEVNEIPFVGTPTILSAEIISEIVSPCKGKGYFKIRIETNAGDRFVTAKRVKLAAPMFSI